MRRTTIAVTAVSALLSLSLVGCAKDPIEAQQGGGGEVATQQKNAALHDQLPDKIKQAGKLVSVNSGSFPPYEIVGSNRDLTGAAADLSEALGQVLGVKIEHVTVEGLSGVLTGIKAGRYDFALGPIGDFPEREADNDFVDWVQEFVVFAVPKGNPKQIKDLDSACGLRIAVMAAGSAEKVIKNQAQKCAAEGKPALEVQSYKDQPSSVLSVKSGRADAFFSSQAPLTYFASQSNGELELAGTGQKNGFDDLYQGAVVPKDSALRDVLLAAMQELFDNGTYAKIMAKWGLDGNKIDKPGVNLAGSKG
ncbi:ABC transporter substrate-binding protein [Micromonospora echinaurantiaca]|uniref:ABC transporter substrate-binding protein n=1 Tax=Micromonospora echinaurantiaca TaxID=47857 RepID=UPI001422C41F